MFQYNIHFSFVYQSVSSFLLQDYSLIHKIHHSNLVIKVNIQIVTRKLLNKIKLYTEYNNINIESFIYKELLFNITKHVLIPNNIKILSESEKESLKLKYNLSNYFNIPHINTSDPLSKFYGLVYGNIIRIIRNSSNAGYYITYRIAK